MTADTAPAREVPVVCRNQAGQFKAKPEVNTHSASHEGGDNTARALGFRVALRPEECEAWGVPYVDEHESGRGVRLFDAVTRLGDRVSVKETRRPNPNHDTSHVITTPSERSIATTTAAILRGAPVLVVAHRGTIDLDRIQFRLLDVAPVLREAGGDVGAIRDRTGAGRPGAGGSGTIWGKWVQRKNKRGDLYGHYWEVSVSVRKLPWRFGTIEEIEREIHAMLHP